MGASLPARVGILGASGGVGRRIARRLADAGVAVRGQTRDAARLAELAGRIEVMAFDPRDAEALTRFVDGMEAIVFCLGTDRMGPTTLFSEATAALVAAMDRNGPRRLVAITGIGAGETRGHGGFLYDQIIFPLFTRHRYADKDRQEALIAASGLDWTILRPAPFAETVPDGPPEVVLEVRPETRLTRVSRDEVADFVVSELASGVHIGKRPFIGHS